MAISQGFTAVLLVDDAQIGVVTNVTFNEEFGQVTVTGINDQFVQRLTGLTDASGEFTVYRDRAVAGQEDLSGNVTLKLCPEGNVGGAEQITIPATITSRGMTIGNEGAATEQSYSWNLAGNIVRSVIA